VTVVGDFLWSLLHPLAGLVKQAESSSAAKSDFAKTLAMVVHTWSVLRRELSLSEEQVELLWADVGTVKVCQCELLQGGTLGFLASLNSEMQPGCFAKCDFVADGDPSAACLLESVRLLPQPSFPDLHECGTTNEFIQAIKVNGNSHPLSRLLSQFASYASDCGYDVLGAVLGPLLSRSASLSEAALTAAPATVLFQLAGSILPKASVRPMKQATFALHKAEPATRARIGHEHEHRNFGAVCYSLQLAEGNDGISRLQQVLCPTGKHPAPLVASAPAPQARGPAEKIVRRASKILKRTFAALDKRKSLAIEKVNADVERDPRRTSARDISANDYAESMVGSENGGDQKRPGGQQQSSNSNNTRSSQRSSQRNSITSRTVPSFAWNDLLSLVEDEEPPKMQAAVSMASLAEFRPWDDPTTTLRSSERKSQAPLLAPSPPPEAGGREQDEELIGTEMQTFLGIDTALSWRDVIQEEDDEDEELSAEFAELIRPAVKKPLPQPLPRSSSTPPAKMGSGKLSLQSAMSTSTEAIQTLGMAPKAPLRVAVSRSSGSSPLPSKATSWKKGGVSSDLVGSGGGNSAVSSPVAPRKPGPALPQQRVSGDKPPRRPLPDVAAAPSSPVNVTPMSPVASLKATGLPSRLSAGFAKSNDSIPTVSAISASEPRTPPTVRPPPPTAAPSSRPPPRPPSQIK
jgi:hypothetical protein